MTGKLLVLAGNSLAILTGKLSAAAIRALGAGLGSNLPGRLARRVSPGVLGSLARQCRLGVIAVTGTNGKSTTSGLIYSIFRRAGYKTVANRQGANLVTGITATMVEASTIGGKLEADYGLFEVDEASLPVVAEEVEFAAVVVTNLFRDQLDRFGELDTTAKLIGNGIARHHSVAVLNCDDPNVAQLADQCRRVYYGIESLSQPPPDTAGGAAGELSYCAACGAEYVYDMVFYSQLGHYRCPSCLKARPRPEVSAADVRVDASGSQFTLRIKDQDCRVSLPLPGLFNVYNALAAAATASWLNVPAVTIADGLKNYLTLFGRSERLTLDGKPVLIQLIKNPAGAGQVLSTVAGDNHGRILIAINDNLADGRDISWLWDAEFELLAGHAHQIVVAGQRACDMAVRLKYAGVAAEQIMVVPRLNRALKAVLNLAQPGETVWILPTYTCLLELQKILKSMGYSLAGT